jgi:hypothetical protein
MLGSQSLRGELKRKSLLKCHYCKLQYHRNDEQKNMSENGILLSIIKNQSEFIIYPISILHLECLWFCFLQIDSYNSLEHARSQTTLLFFYNITIAISLIVNIIFSNIFSRAFLFKRVVSGLESGLFDTFDECITTVTLSINTNVSINLLMARPSSVLIMLFATIAVLVTAVMIPLNHLTSAQNNSNASTTTTQSSATAKVQAGGGNNTLPYDAFYPKQIQISPGQSVSW